MVAIKDMEMPSCCGSCFARTMVDGTVSTYEMCDLTQSVLSVEDLTINRHKDCPLVSLHEINDCMEKLQKIEQIVEGYKTDNPKEPMYETEDYMNSIIEVVET